MTSKKDSEENTSPSIAYVYEFVEVSPKISTRHEGGHKSGSTAMWSIRDWLRRRNLLGLANLRPIGFAAVSIFFAAAISSAATLETSFEDPGYVAGSGVDRREGWKKDDPEGKEAEAIVSTEKSFGGSQCLKLPPRSAVKRATLQGDIRFYDVEILPHFGDGSDATKLNLCGGILLFEKQNSHGQIRLMPGSGNESVLVRGGIDLEEEGADIWVRVSARVDTKNKEWDLFLEGKPIKARIALAAGDGWFSAAAPSGGAVFIDDYFESTENPLFEDVDKDGMPDAEEWIYGMSPGVNDRNGDLDGDGTPNVDEFFSGTAARRAGLEEDFVLFVDNLSGDDANSGKSSQIGLGSGGPKASIKAAMSAAKDGSTIVVTRGKGVYDEGSRNAGGKKLTIKPVAPITIK